MTDKETKAIERMKDLIHTCEIGIEKYGEYDDLFQKDKEAIETVLNLIEKKDKIIELMAEQLTTPIHSKEWVIEYYTKKVEGK